MNIKKKQIYNILFWGFIIFLFTPYGLGTRAKLTQGVTYVKGLVFPPKVVNVEDRVALNTYNLNLKGVAYAEDINLESLKNRVVLINHWATWCPPCRAEMPSLQSLYNDYKDKVTFLFLTTDNRSKVDEYYADEEFNLPTYNVLSSIPSQINTTSLPATFLIDKEGKVVLSEYGAADWNSKKVRTIIDKLLE